MSLINDGQYLGWDAATSTFVPTTPGAGPGGTVSASGTLANFAIVTGAGTAVVKTPSLTSTLDTSGNMSLAGHLSLLPIGPGLDALATLKSVAGNAELILDAHNGGDAIARVTFTDNGTNKWAIGLPLSGTDRDFKIYDWAASASRLTIDTSGKVAIPGVTQCGVGTFSGFGVPSGVSAPTVLSIANGTSASPETSANPILSVSDVFDAPYTAGVGRVTMHFTKEGSTNAAGFEGLRIWARQTGRIDNDGMRGIYIDGVAEVLGTANSHHAADATFHKYVPCDITAMEFDVDNQYSRSVIAGTNTTPISLTTNVIHNLTTGHRITNSGILGLTAANGTFSITVTGPSTFTLDGSVGNGAYISGGTVALHSAQDYGDVFTIYNNSQAVLAVGIGLSKHTAGFVLSTQGTAQVSSFYTGVDLRPDSIDTGTARAIRMPNATYLDSWNAGPVLGSDSYHLIGGTASNNIVIAPNGQNVGVGTLTPSAPLHVVKNQNSFTNLVVSNNSNGSSAQTLVQVLSDVSQLQFSNYGSGFTGTRWGQTLAGYSEVLGSVSGNGMAIGTFGAASLILGTNSTAVLTINPAGNVNVNGVVTATGFVSDLFSVSLGTGGTTTPTAAVLSHRELKLTGALTSDPTLVWTVSGSPTSFFIYNLTTPSDGLGRSVLIKTDQSGSTGIRLPQGYGAWFWHDGTNVWQRSGMIIPKGADQPVVEFGTPAFTHKPPDGSQMILGHLWVGNSDRIPNPGVTNRPQVDRFINSPAYIGVAFEETYTGSMAEYAKTAGFSAILSLNPSDNQPSTRENYGIRGIIDASSSSSKNFYELYGAEGVATFGSSGTCGGIYGARGDAQMYGAGTFTSLFGVFALARTTGGSGTGTDFAASYNEVSIAHNITTTKVYGVISDVHISAGTHGSVRLFQALSPTITGGTITGSLYGLLLPDLSGFTVGGSAYNIYSTGANSINTFEGTLQVGKAVVSTVASVDLGSTTKPFRDIYSYGSGTYGTNYFKLTGSPTAARTITIPDATGTLAISPLTTKGDLWGFSTVDARIPVSSNGKVFVADSTQTLGLGWSSYILTGSSGKTYTFPIIDDTLAGLGTANVFTANQTISNAAPSLAFTDTTASAKSLTIVVDANIANLRESAGASGSLAVLDLANNRLGVGTAAPGSKVQVSLTALASAPGLGNNGGHLSLLEVSNYGMLLGVLNSGDGYIQEQRTDGTATAYNLQLQPSGGKVGIGMAPTKQLELSTDSAQKPTTNTWTIASDKRIKKDIHPYTQGLASVLLISPCRYHHSGRGLLDEESIHDPYHVGVIADDLLPVLPELVSFSRGMIDGKEVDGVLHYEGHNTTFMLINSVKELHSQLQSANQRILELERMVN